MVGAEGAGFGREAVAAGNETGTGPDRGRPDGTPGTETGRPDGTPRTETGRPDGTPRTRQGRPDGTPRTETGRPDGTPRTRQGRPDGEPEGEPRNGEAAGQEAGRGEETPGQQAFRRDEPGQEPPRTDKRRYFVLMGVCVALFVVSWAVVDRYSVLAAVIMSAVALVIPPFAAIVANVASATDRRRP
jgi:Protein of unknown function (DUF3099)